MYAIQWEGNGDTPYVMISRIADQLRTQLNTLKNTEKLKVFGGTDEEVIIEVDSSKLSSLGLTFTDLSRIIKGLDSKKPIGVISNDQSEYLFKLKDNIKINLEAWFKLEPKEQKTKRFKGQSTLDWLTENANMLP